MTYYIVDLPYYILELICRLKKCIILKYDSFDPEIDLLLLKNLEMHRSFISE